MSSGQKNAYEDAEERRLLGNAAVVESLGSRKVAESVASAINDLDTILDNTGIAMPLHVWRRLLRVRETLGGLVKKA